MPRVLLTNSAAIRKDDVTDVIRSLFNPEFEDNLMDADAAPAVISDAFLAANADLFHLDGMGLELEAELESGAQITCRYRQVINSIPVDGAGFHVTMEKSGRRVVSVRNTLKYDLPAGLANEPAAVSAADARRIVHERFDSEHDRIMTSEPRLTILERRLAWSIGLDTVGPKSYLDIVVDATDGSFVAVRDRRRFSAGPLASIFMPDPLTSSRNTGLHWDSPETELDRELVEVVLENLDDPEEEHPRLQGKWVRIVEDSADEPLVIPAAAGASCRSHDPRLLSAMAYYYTDQLVTWLLSLGIPAFNAAMTVPFEVIPRAAENGDNSYFVVPLQGPPSLAFGIGGTPDASDPGVIVHEFGHAVHYLLFGRLVEAGPWEEGFCDFLSCVFRDRYNRHGFDRANPFPWDNNPTVSWNPERRCDVAYVFDDPVYRTFDLYRKGTIHASALWNIYLDMGGKSDDLTERMRAADEITGLYLDMLIAAGDAGPLEDLVHGLIRADHSRTGGANVEYIRQAFLRRGFDIH